MNRDRCHNSARRVHLGRKFGRIQITRSLRRRAAISGTRSLKSDGSPGNDAHVAVITNRDAGYRWILHRGSATVEFQTPGMLAEQVAGDYLDVYLSVEEAEALADAAGVCRNP